MSYRELRNFTEMLQALGFNRLVSIENFRQPNFPLVAEILAWLLKRYDSGYEVPMEVDSEQDRIIFIKSCAQILIQKAQIKVNPKKLYQADGYAVQEMLKVASVLYKATMNKTDLNSEADDNFNMTSTTSTVHKKLNELRASRQLATDITQRGASLYDLLSKEVDLREYRSAALARPMELSEVEKNMRSVIKAVEDEIKQTMQNLDNIASDETNLDAKISKKSADLERQQKRLAQLQSVRPAYMDEYENLEEELKELYNQYVQKSRNLAYLEHMQSEYEKAEQDRATEAEQSLKKLAERMREEQREQIAQNEKLVNVNNMSNEFSDEEHEQVPKGPKIYGSMTGGASDDDEDEDDSLLTDDDDDDDEELQDEKRIRPSPAQPAVRQQFSDESDVELKKAMGNRGKKLETSEPKDMISEDEDDDDDF